jgi:hypothetical protein
VLHVQDSDLALFATGDLAQWQRLKVSIHVRRCDACRSLVDAYRGDAEYLKAGALDLPEGVDWDRLSAEMNANIHVGLAAGECVAKPGKRRQAVNVWDGFWGWRAAAAGVGVMVLLVCAWWLNMPRSDTQALGSIWQVLLHSGPFGPPEVERGPIVAASAEKIAMRENGSGLEVADLDGDDPLTVTVSNTEASAQFVVEDTGQLVITTVYVQ